MGLVHATMKSLEYKSRDVGKSENLREVGASSNEGDIICPRLK